MLQAYSLQQTLVDGATIPLNNTVIEKGVTAILSAPASIELNKAGIYMVHCDAIVTGTDAGDGTIQLTKNGLPLPYAKSTETLVADEASALDFESLVQVSQNNTCCCLTGPTTLQFRYTGAAATGDVNVVVTKIC